MKNVLFATSALVAMGGAAFADGHAGLSLTGEARLGLIYVDGGVTSGPGEPSDVTGTSRVRLGVSATGTSDSGLTFGASARLDQGDASDQSDNQGSNRNRFGNVSSNGSVFVSGAFGTLSYQDVDDASEKRVSNVDFISLTARGDVHEITRSAVAGSIIRYDYDMSGFGLSVSANGGLKDFQVGAGYSGEFAGTSVSVGIGYDDFVSGGHIAASAGVGFSGVDVKLAYSTNDNDDDYAASVKYDAGALDVGVFYIVDSTGGVEEEAYGLGASYDLGGGLSLKGSVFDGDVATTADFGLAMKF